jgi:hypothetical protein
MVVDWECLARTETTESLTRKHENRARIIPFPKVLEHLEDPYYAL